jgi:hypothetical protein
MASFHLSAAVLATNSAVTGYWRHALASSSDNAELWLYRNEPEIGVNVHAPSDMQWVGPDSIGSLLVRHTVYWENPLAQSVAQLHEAVALAPAGTTMLIMVSSKVQCVDYRTPGNREAKFSAYAAYLRALAASAPRSGRVGVLYWQVYNEMNMQGWTNMFGGPMAEGDSSCAGDGSSRYVQGQHYADLLRQVYPAIKEATHDSGWLVMGGLGSDDAEGTDVYGPSGRYGFLHGMYANGAKEFYDIAAIQPYGRPGAPGLHRSADFDRALAVYGDEARPMFLTEFGSRYTGAQHWSDLLEQIEAVQNTRMYSKAFIYVLCSGNERYSLRAAGPAGACASSTEAYRQLQSRQLNTLTYGRDSVVYTDVIVRQARGNAKPLGYAVEDGESSFRILHVPVHYREPTRVRFETGSTAGKVALGVQYRVFVASYGWTDWRSDSGEVSAVVASRPIHAVQLRVVHADDAQAYYGVGLRGTWSPSVSNGAMAGDTSRAISGFRGTFTEANPLMPRRRLCYQVRITGAGWSGPKCDGASADAGNAFGTLDGLRAWVALPK